MNQTVQESTGFQPSANVSSRGRILIVDDDRLNRTILTRFLETRGFDAVQASNAKEAFQAVKQHDVDLVLLDIVMPGMDGVEVLARLRKEHSESELPVVMVTADGEKKQVVRAFELGANDYITKPIDTDVASLRIEIQLKLKRAQLALQASEERFSLAAMGANDGLWDWKLNDDEIYYSPRWKSLLGMEDGQPFEGLEGWFSRVYVEDLHRMQTELETHLRGDVEHFESQFRMRHEDGDYRWVLCRGMAVRDANGKATRIAGSLTDINDGKAPDALTGLPNRRLFRHRLQRTADQNPRINGEGFAVLFVDLDKFKEVNDTLGHEAGDLLLIEVARRLEGCVRASDAVVARMGGDEFTVLLDRLPAQRIAERVARRIVDAMKEPFELSDGNTVSVSASVGLNYSTASVNDLDEFLRGADVAMYAVKSNGRSDFQSYVSSS